MGRKKNTGVFKMIVIGIVCLNILLFSSGCSSVSEGVNNPDRMHKLRVVVLTGGHAFEQEPFYKMFSDYESFDIDHVKIKKECAYFDDISQWDYDVIVFYNFKNRLSETGRENLLNLSKKGVGMVVLHHAIAGFPEWSMWPKIVGGQYFLEDAEVDGKAWKRSTYKHDVKFKVKVEGGNSPVTAGVKDFEILDETYKGYWVDSGNKILLTTDEPLSQKEIGWTRSFEKSSVCYIQLGHDKEAYGNSNYRLLLKKSINWVGRNDL